MTTDRFLGIGINEYPSGSELYGCVPDMKECCTNADKYGLDLRVCSDKRAYRSGMFERMVWFTSNLKPGDRALFWYSGHGAQIPTRSTTGEVDGLQEVLCPVDFDFSYSGTWIKDTDFIDIFRGIPEGVNCTVVLDACFSGGMIGASSFDNRRITINKDIIATPRSYPHSIDMHARTKSAERKGLVVNRFVKAEKLPNVAFILLCQEGQTCAETYFHGDDFRGVGTKFLWEAILENPQNSIREVVGIASKKLEDRGFTQRPTIIGPDEILRKPFMERL